MARNPLGRLLTKIRLERKILPLKKRTSLSHRSIYFSTKNFNIRQKPITKLLTTVINKLECFSLLTVSSVIVKYFKARLEPTRVEPLTRHLALPAWVEVIVSETLFC
jgi:hypothetical protein